jgi:menaquinone-dependent protoporphyrinogen oxidase
VLLKKQTGYFLCNAYPDTIQKTIKANFLPELIDSAICIESFGGYAPFSPPKDDPDKGIDVDRIKKAAESMAICFY